jgi:hypothetical protein
MGDDSPEALVLDVRGGPSFTAPEKGTRSAKEDEVEKKKETSGRNIQSR